MSTGVVGEQSEQPLLDQVAVDSLLSLGTEFFSKILAAFELSWEEDWLRLQQCVAEEDCAGARAVAHRMKSSSANLGATGLSTICAAIESAARDGQVHEVAARTLTLDKMFEYYSRALHAVTKSGT